MSDPDNFELSAESRVIERFGAMEIDWEYNPLLRSAEDRSCTLGRSERPGVVMEAGEAMPRIFFESEHKDQALVWLLAPVWLALSSYLLYTAVVAGSMVRLAVTAAIWLFGIAIAITQLRRPLVSITVGSDGVIIREILPWRERESRYAAAELSVPDLVKHGGRGEPYFECLLRLPDNRLLTVAIGKDTAAVRRRLLVALHQCDVAAEAIDQVVAVPK